MDAKDMASLIHMKKMLRIVKDKRHFDAYMRGLERKLRFMNRMRPR